MTIGLGDASRFLSKSEIRQVVAKGANSLELDNKRVLVLIPDGTRTMPLPLTFQMFQELIAPRTSQLDFLVALGTHQIMTEVQLSKLVGVEVLEGKAGESIIYNHHWEDPDTFTQLGMISAEEIKVISNGMLEMDVPVSLNKMVLDYDQIIILGPVFPHEVVGFSGGNKYFFPGIGGSEIINFTHWLGALITNYEIIGSGYTPVRAVIDRAVEMIPTPTACFSLVVVKDGVHGIYFGSAREAWESASALSSQVHIRYVEKPYKLVLAIMPELYDDFWTAAKGMYKLEPVIANCGEVVIYAPHIDEISYTHGKVIEKIGYHVRDYFVKQWEEYKNEPWGVLAHSTHAKGMGNYDEKSGVETPRVKVTLATGIPKEICEKINLGYLDPDSIDLNEWEDRETEGILVVEHAGEMLYRLKNGALNE
ncbi:MAG: lactate racemase domain-containing protein [Anaerolineaceae bacterium]|nr:lactate racemase domain-containing protein [Anaerolineaceae bacterium]